MPHARSPPASLATQSYLRYDTSGRPPQKGTSAGTARAGVLAVRGSRYRLRYHCRRCRNGIVAHREKARDDQARSNNKLDDQHNREQGQTSLREPQPCWPRHHNLRTHNRGRRARPRLTHRGRRVARQRVRPTQAGAWAEDGGHRGNNSGCHDLSSHESNVCSILNSTPPDAKHQEKSPACSIHRRDCLQRVHPMAPTVFAQSVRHRTDV